MKHFLKYALFFITISLVFSCSREEYKNYEYEQIHHLETLTQKLTLTKSSKEVSKLFASLGISQIELIPEDNKTIINLTSEKSFKFRGDFINASDYSVKVSDKLVTLNEDEQFQIGIVENKAFIFTPDYVGFYDEADLTTKENIKTFILIGFLNEILYKKEKFSYGSSSKAAIGAGCSFIDQVFSVGVGINSTSAKADLESSMEDDIAEGGVDGCTKVGEPEEVAFTGGTVWAQTWCCP